VTRIKVISRLDISEKRVPQDGAHEARAERPARHRFPGQHASDPVRREDRDADPGSVPGQNGIESLGYEPEQRRTHLVAAITRPYGMVLATGPTAAAKTVSLYTCLNMAESAGREHLDRGGSG